VAARRLLAEGFALAKIAKYTAVVTTDALTSYLEKSDRASEAELLVAAFKAEPVGRSKLPAIPVNPMHRAHPVKPMPALPTGMGMVDVMHEMRDMERRVQSQLQGMRDEVQSILGEAIKNLDSRSGDLPGAEALKAVVGQFGQLMDETVGRFDALLQKPTMLIEKQIDQQRYMFEEAHRQKEYLDKMFGGLLEEQRRDLEQMFHAQQRHLADLAERQIEASLQLAERIARLQEAFHAERQELQELLKNSNHPPISPTPPEKKEGAA
jgi:hypothetical protein